MELSKYLEIRRCFNEIRQEAPSASRVIFDEFAILCTLHDRKGLSATELANEQGISCPTMTHRGGHLSQLGLITRASSADDRRRLRCSLTRKGTSYVNRTAAFILDLAQPPEDYVGVAPEQIIGMVARMGTVNMAADSLTLLCYENAAADSLPVMRIVETTALLQPTVSMAVLRMEKAGYIEENAVNAETGRRTMRREGGCVITPAGRRRAAELRAIVEGL